EGLHLKAILPDFLYNGVEKLAAIDLPGESNVQKLAMGMVNRATDLVVDGSVKQGITYVDNEQGLALRIDAAMAATLRQREKITDDIFDKYAASMGYSKTERAYFYKSQLPYPSVPDLMLWARYFTPVGEDKKAFDEKFDIPDEDYEIWKWQTLQRLTTDHVQTLLKRGLFIEEDFNKELSKIGWSPTDQPKIKDLAYILPNAMLQVQGGLMQDIGNDKILKNISKSDIHPDYAQTYLDAVLTKPASRDIIEYQLRQDSTLTNLPKELKKVGIHPDYLELYKTLAYPIPPV
ncbi:unnamed protein product, partial [marine sediment metagenome]